LNGRSEASAPTALQGDKGAETLASAQRADSNATIIKGVLDFKEDYLFKIRKPCLLGRSILGEVFFGEVKGVKDDSFKSCYPFFTFHSFTFHFRGEATLPSP
jgi:hypothetical protein